MSKPIDDHYQKGYPFPPRHSIAWDNNEYGITYDEAVSLYEHEKAKLPNPNIAFNPLRLVTRKEPHGSQSLVKAMNEELSPPLAKNLTESRTAPTLSPNSAYWPPYDFTAPDGQKELKVRYDGNLVKFGVLAPDEWKAFFDSFDATKTVVDAGTGTYNAIKTAESLGGLGVKAFVKKIDGVEYLILKDYDIWKQSILHGGVFKANNPQVVKMGLGALDSVQGMTKFVKVTAPMEILVGSAINVLQFIVNDEYTLEKLGVEQAKLFVHAVLVAGTAFAIGAAIPVTLGVVGTLTIICISNFAVWMVDKVTNFEEKMIEAAIGVF